jgi:mannosyltransferase OCH1-like enzyme
VEIPRVFHRIWIGPRPMPAEYKAFGRTWLEHHPGWGMIDWRESDIPQVHPELVRQCRRLSNAVNLLRYYLLFANGGVYIDCDFECRRSIEPLLEGADFVTASQIDDLGHPDALANGFIACTPGHPIMRALVDGIPDAFDASHRNNCGPPYFTRTVLEQGAGAIDVRVCPARYFYPYLWTEPERRYEQFPDAYAVHHWAGRDGLKSPPF